jgi:anti-anti-sigma factor
MALKVDVRQVGDVSIMDLKGALSLAERQVGGEGTVLENARALVDAGKKKIVLNFAGVTNMDSAGIGQLIGTLTSVRSRGGQIRILKPSRDVRKTLELTQLAKAVEIHDDEESALRAYGGGSAAA